MSSQPVMAPAPPRLASAPARLPPARNPRLPVPPTLRAARLGARFGSPPPRMEFSASEKNHPTIHSPLFAATKLSTLAGRATQPNRPSFATFAQLSFENSGAITLRDTRIHSNGIVFGDVKYEMQLDDFIVDEALGEGNYGSVTRATHLPTGTVMAMKETKISFEQREVERIIQELDILHRARAPNIVKFHGAFTIESRVYSLMEYMDAGSLDKLTFIPGALYQAGDEQLVWQPVPEPVLARMTASTVRGLKALKDDLDVMHRDVKPTNVLMNLKGEVKLCDFGVSKHLENSIAKTQIGCQSYMAPERIQSGSAQGSEYTVAADVWSLGLTVIELAVGEYPYNSEPNVLAQMQSILMGPVPTLPSGYSATSMDWVARTLDRNDQTRASYVELLEHPFLKDEENQDVDMAGWVATAMKFKGSKLLKRSAEASS